MKALHRRARALTVLVGVTALALPACGRSVSTDVAMPAAAAPIENTIVSAAPLRPRAELERVARPQTAVELRVAYNEVLDEHALLSMMATAASLGNRPAELEAASAQLQANAEDLADLVSQIYDEKTGAAFSTFWRKHIGFFLEYTAALGRADHVTAARASADLETYAADLEALLKSSTESMPVGVVRALVTKHIHNVDHQHTGDWQAAYADILPAIDNMRVISDHLTLGVQVKYGDRYTGDTSAPASTRGTSIVTGLQVNAALFGIAGGAAIDGRDREVGQSVSIARENIERLAGELSDGDPDPAIERVLTQLVNDLDAYSRGVEQPTASSSDASKRLDGDAATIASALTARYPRLAGSDLEPLLRTYIAGLQQTMRHQAAGEWSAAFTTMSQNEAHATLIADVITSRWR